MLSPRLALIVVPLALVACAPPGGEPPAVAEAEVEAPAVDRGPQERSCAGSAAAQLGLPLNAVTAAWASEGADGRSIVSLNAGGALYNCTVDASGNVLNLESLTL